MKFFLVVLFFNFPLTGFSYPEIVSKNCSHCHTEASGYGILTTEGRSHSEFKIETPKWLLLGAKLDLNQYFAKTPYEESAKFEVKRTEVQLGLSHSYNNWNFHAQGALNRFTPTGERDSVSDYIFSPYHFTEVRYNKNANNQNISVKHGYYLNEVQKDLVLSQTSYKQTELIYVFEQNQFNLGIADSVKTYNSVTDTSTGYLHYKYLDLNRYSVLLGYQKSKSERVASFHLNFFKKNYWHYRFMLAETKTATTKGIRTRLQPIYQMREDLKLFAIAEYINPHIELSAPRIIFYGFGADYFVISQGMLSLVYSKTDDSLVINNPTEKVELNFHLYM